MNHVVKQMGFSTGTCGVKATSEILSHVVQCAGKTQRQRMIGSETRGKSFIFFSALLGSIQVVCGVILLLLAAINFWEQIQNPFNTSLLEIITSLIAITSGAITIAFAIFRGKALRRAVQITSILSCIFAVYQFLLMVTSVEKHAQCRAERFNGANESVTLLGIIINAIFLFFLSKRSESRPKCEDSEEDPPPYEVAIQNNSSQEGFGETRSLPIYTISHNSHYEANIANR